MLEKSRRGEKKMIGPELLEMSTIRNWPSASEDASARSSSLWIRRLADSSHHGQSLPSPAALALVRPSSPHIGRTSPWSPSMSPPSSRSRPCFSLLLLPPQAPSTLSMPQEVSGDGLPGSKACIFIESTASSGSECRCFWSESLADEMGKDEEVGGRMDARRPAAGGTGGLRRGVNGKDSEMEKSLRNTYIPTILLWQSSDILYSRSRLQWTI